MKPEPLPPDLRALLEDARPLEHAPADARARIALAVALSAAAPAAAAASVALGAGAGSAAHEVGKAIAKTGLALSPFAKTIGIAAVCLTVGGTTGAALHATFTEPSPPNAAETRIAAAPPAPRPTAAPASTIPTVAANDLPIVPPSSTAARAPDPPAAQSPAAAASSAIAEEQQLLDRARVLLARGDPQGALAPLEAHTRRFPGGVLTEERDALTIQALARTGRAAEAEDRASRFRREYPKSLMAPAVDDAMRGMTDPK